MIWDSTQNITIQNIVISHKETKNQHAHQIHRPAQNALFRIPPTPPVSSAIAMSD